MSKNINKNEVEKLKRESLEDSDIICFYRFVDDNENNRRYSQLSRVYFNANDVDSIMGYFEKTVVRRGYTTIDTSRRFNNEGNWVVILPEGLLANSDSDTDPIYGFIFNAVYRNDTSNVGLVIYKVKTINNINL